MNMNASYTLVMLAGALLAAGLFAWRLKKAGLRPACALIALPLWAACGYIGAKALYFLLMINRELRFFSLAQLLRFSPDKFSFLGGCLGAVGGTALAARLTGQPLKKTLDAFAPAGALAVAFARAAERFLGEVNWSAFEVASPLLQRFPLADANMYGQWYLALYAFAALAALAVGALFLLRKKEAPVAGLRFERAAFYLCLPQIFLESLRSDSLYWGFVRPEQVLCAVILFLLLAHHCKKARKGGFIAAFWPLAVNLLCIGVMVFVEFNLDKQFIPMSETANYALMWLALAGIAACECFAARRRMKQAA